MKKSEYDKFLDTIEKAMIPSSQTFDPMNDPQDTSEMIGKNKGLNLASRIFIAQFSKTLEE